MTHYYYYYYFVNYLQAALEVSDCKMFSFKMYISDSEADMTIVCFVFCFFLYKLCLKDIVHHSASNVYKA